MPFFSFFNAALTHSDRQSCLSSWSRPHCCCSGFHGETLCVLLCTREKSFPLSAPSLFNGTFAENVAFIEIGAKLAFLPEWLWVVCVFVFSPNFYNLLNSRRKLYFNWNVWCKWWTFLYSTRALRLLFHGGLTPEKSADRILLSQLPVELI